MRKASVLHSVSFIILHFLNHVTSLVLHESAPFFFFFNEKSRRLFRTRLSFVQYGGFKRVIHTDIVLKETKLEEFFVKT